MTTFLTPRRRYGTELLDGPGADESLVLRTVADISRSNFVFQGARSAVRALTPYMRELPREATLLDVGTGLGDVPRSVQRYAARAGISLTTIGADIERVLLKGARDNVSHTVCASALALPFATSSVDIVLCSQTLHHFRGDDARTLVREMDRVARVAVAVSDLRRSWIAAGGFWLASYALGFHGVTRHDGVVSVLRGFTQQELADTVYDAVGARPLVRRRLGYRVTATWKPAPAR